MREIIYSYPGNEPLWAPDTRRLAQYWHVRGTWLLIRDLTTLRNFYRSCEKQWNQVGTAENIGILLYLKAFHWAIEKQ